MQVEGTGGTGGSRAVAGVGVGSGATRVRRVPAGVVAAGGGLAALAVGYVLQVGGVLAGSGGAVVGGAAVGLLTEVWLSARGNGLARFLVRAQLHLPVRQLLRDGLLLGGLARADALRPASYAAWLLVAVLGCWAVHFVCQAVAARVRRSRRLPVVTRNIDASALRLRPAPPSLLGRSGSERLMLCSALITAGAAVTAGTGDARWAAATALACWAALLAGTVHLASWLLPGRRPAGEDEVLAWLDTWLADYRPTVGMYFSGGVSSAYQANMWLPTLAGLDENPVVVLRERFMVQLLDATDLPVVCIPKVAHLMRLEHSTLHVMLHPSNSGKTSQVLRIPTIKHAFINHGESDKLSSCNPYAKAYDEVWVAGPAARERYLLAEVGVRDEDIREVGRPQLEPIRPYAGPPESGAPVTVLYAPTWEGWTDDPGNTSLPLAGENIVHALLADPGVRLLYKPHPMTGSVDPAVKAADLRIRALVAEAGGRGGNDVPGPPSPGGQPTDGRGDEAERMLRQSGGSGPGAERAAAEVEAWEERFWQTDPAAHLVLAGPRPGVHSCFNQADLLVSDVSSVVADHLASEKPYAVVNTTGLPEEEFRAAFPTVRAATILTPGAEGVPALLESVRDPGRDVLRAARAELKAYLLGPDDPPAAVRFAAAVADLRARAEAHRTRRATPGTPDAPRPSGASRPSEEPRPSGASRPSEEPRPSGASRPSDAPRKPGEPGAPAGQPPVGDEAR